MHRDTILRIEDSLRATAEGSLKWLQGQRVPIPMVDERVNVILRFSSPKRLEGEEDKDRSELKQAATAKKGNHFTLPSFPSSFPSPFPSSTATTASATASASARDSASAAYNQSTSDLMQQPNSDTNKDSNNPLHMSLSANNIKSTNGNSQSNSKYSEPMDLSSLSLESVPLPHRPDSMPTTPSSSPSMSLKKTSASCSPNGLFLFVFLRLSLHVCLAA